MVQLVERPKQLLHQENARGERALVVNSDCHQVQPTTTVAYRVVHVTKGRIRFRVPRLYNDLFYTERLQGLLGAVSQVKRVRINQAASCVTVDYIAPGKDREVALQVIKAIKRASSITSSQGAKTDRREEGSSWSGLGLPAIAMLFSLLSGPLGWSISPILVRGAIALAALPVAKRACQEILSQHRLNVDFLDLSALTIITAQGHFITSASMLALIELGETIRDLTARSSQNRTQGLLSSLDQVVWIERDGQKLQVSLQEVQLGDVVIAYPGEQIPVDGRILRGQALIDEQKLTGESMPVVRSSGETVYASTLVREGRVYIVAQKLGADTRAGRTVQLIQEAPVHDTRIENYAAKIANRAVVPTLLLGGAVFALTRSPARTASVLTLDFATGIRVSVPTTVLAALSQAARHGILIRSGRALEKLAQIDTIVFDKTGTLTLGEVTVVSIESLSHLSTLEVLRFAAAAEQRITHPVAEAITRYAQMHEVEIPPRGHWQYQVGLGLEAQIEGRTVLVGSDRFLAREGVSLEPLEQGETQFLESGLSSICIAIDGKLHGVLQYQDPLRPESLEVVTALRTAIGAEIHLLTGDQRQRAKVIAAQLAIPQSQTHAEAFPEQKAEIVQTLHEAGHTVAFVGDGINDSAALAYADVSISFRDGSDIARETADVVLMNNNLHGLVEAIAIARNAQQIIHQNTGIVAIPNLSGLAIAATFGLNPMLATAINNGSSVVAGLNGLRPVLNGYLAQDDASRHQK